MGRALSRDSRDRVVADVNRAIVRRAAERLGISAVRFPNQPSRSGKAAALRKLGYHSPPPLNRTVRFPHVIAIQRSELSKNPYQPGMKLLPSLSIYRDIQFRLVLLEPISLPTC